MEKLLVIAEKPSLEAALKATYIAHKSEIPYELHFTHLVGHACRLLEPKEYDEWKDEKWKDISLPMVPKTWKIGTISDTYKLYKNIVNTFNTGNFDGIIAAEDPEREGNYIHYLLEQKAGFSKVKTYRIWLNNGLTDDAILNSYLHMTDFHNDDTQKRLTNAAILRGEKDWLMGMNFTVGSTVKFGTLMNIGSVKSCVINMVYMNSETIDNFIPSTSYNLVANFKDFNATQIDMDENQTPIKYPIAQAAIDFGNSIGKEFTVSDYNCKTTKTYAPELFKLSTIQSEAGKLFGYDPKKTLDIMQRLYDNKLLTYPRTGCQYLSTSIAKTIPSFMRVIETFPDLAPVVKTVNPIDVSNIEHMSKYTNDTAVKKDAHTAVMPTSKKPNLSALDDEEKNILHLVYSRLLAICLPPLVEEKSVVYLDNNGNTFKANGKKIISNGYTTFTKTAVIEADLPKFTNGQKLICDNYSADEKITTPPTRYTASTLLKDMNNAQKFVTDKDLKSILTEIEGIGTPATQADIIKTIIKEGYVEEKKGRSKENQLFITEKGKFYCTTLKDFDFMNPASVAQIESHLKKVSDGDLSFNECEDIILKYINDVVLKINTSNSQLFKDSQFNTTKESANVGNCPDCGSPMVKYNWGYGCLGYKSGCKFSIGKIAGKLISEAQVKKILKNGISDTIKGFTGKKGSFDAKLKLEKEDGVSKLKFDFSK